MSGVRRPRRGALRAAVATIVLAILALPTLAAAAVVSSAELEVMAEAALAGDAIALERLREVERVDGRPARIGEALAGAEGSQLEARLERIAAVAVGGAEGASGAEALREEAARIVGELPQPDPDGPESESQSSALEEGGGLEVGPLGLAVAAIALVGGGLLAYRLSRGRERTYAERAAEDASGADGTPEELIGRAERAEAEGDYAAALRLRLRWALAMLGRSGAVDGRSSLTPAAAARQLSDPRAEELVATFERVVYGRHSAVAADAEAAREGWPRVIEAASGR